MRIFGVFLIILISACGGDNSAPNSVTDAGDFGADTSVVDADAETDMGPGVIDPITAGYFDSVASVRDALRESPDHLHARANALVQAGDAEALFEFVRAEIAIHPTVTDNLRPRFDLSAAAVVSGPRGALRGGSGTMRDRAETLAYLYRQAGWNAEVVGPLENALSVDDFYQLVFTEYSQTPELDVDEDTRTQWEATFGARPLAERSLQVVPYETAALETSILDAIPTVERGQIEGDPQTEIDLPIVRLERDGETLHLDVVSPAATFANVEEAESLSALEAADYADVRVSVSYTSTHRPDEWLPLLNRTWQADEVIGRQLQLRFNHGTSTVDQLASLSSSLEVATPLLIAQGPELNDDDAAALTGFGDAFTLDGRRIVEGDNEIPEFADQDFGISGEIGPVEDVEAIVELSADPASFAQVDLYLEANDDSGNGVAGLGAGAFEIYEDGQRLSHALVRNRATPLDVLLLIDNSTSIPENFRSAEFAAHIGGLVDGLQTSYPGEVRLAPVGITDFAQSRLAGDFIADSSEIEARLVEIYSRDSVARIWDSLEVAAGQDHDLTVLITDADDITEGFEPSSRLLLQNGPDVLFIGPDGFAATIDQMVDFTGGEQVEVTLFADVDGPLSEWVNRQPGQAYALSYRAPLEGPDDRQVEVRTSDGRVTAATSYEVPPLAERRIANEVLGVRLEVEIDGRGATRVIGGIDPANLTDLDFESQLDDIRRMIKSEFLISIEAHPPKRSAWLDDYLTMRLTQEMFFSAYRQADTQMAQAAYERGFKHVDPRLFAVHPPFDDAFAGSEFRTFATAPRVTVFSKTWSAEDEALRLGYDVMPISRWTTIDVAGDSNFEENFRRTARIAAAESANFSISTASLLDGQTLVRIAPQAEFDAQSDFSVQLDEANAKWWTNALDNYSQWHRFVPADGGTRAFWVVNQDTGELFGILEDGTGGGAVIERLQRDERIKDILKDIDKLSAAAGLAAGSLSAAILIEYYKLLIRLYAIVSVVVGELDAFGLEEALKAAMLGFACNLVRTIIFSTGGYLAENLGVFDALLTLFGIPNPTACPDPFTAD